MRTRNALRPAAAYLVAAVTVFPLIWLLVGALRPASDTFTTGLPTSLTLDNFRRVLTEVPFERYLLNSALVSVAVTVVALLFHSMAAYALARLRFPGRRVVFSVIVSTMMVSLPVILVPLFIIVRELGLIDTYGGLIVPGIFHAFGIFLLRQYYLNIPPELEEAADLDGCGYLRRYLHVIVPLSRPMLASLAVLFFLTNWNAFLWPLTITRDPELRLVQIGIATLQGQYAAAWNLVLAAAVIAAIPTVAVFVIGQRRLIESLKTTGLK